MSNVVCLCNLTIADRRIVGGKGANLGELTRMMSKRVKVPPGFCIPTTTFDQSCKSIKSELERDMTQIWINNYEIEVNASHAIQSLRLPNDIREEIQATFAHMFKDELVAVRSSASGEDSDHYAFAGLGDTFLNCTSVNLIRSIKKCWASLYTARSIEYRKHFGLTTGSMGVVIQKMIEAEKAGVIFTVDPRNDFLNHEQMIIEANFGYGVSIVGGLVSPDQYVIQKSTGTVIKKKVQDKKVQVIKDAKKGVIIRDMPECIKKDQCLNDDEIKQLNHIAREVENHFRKPQDIEFAIEKNSGQIWILQSRPIIFIN